MKYPRPAIAFVTFMAVLGLLWSSTTLGPKPNRFAVAQSQTVIVDNTPDSSFGSGVVVRRVNPYGNERVFVWTARHVLPEVPPYLTHVKIIHRFEGKPAGESLFPARAIGLSTDDVDVALLWVDIPLSLAPPGVTFAETGALSVGDAIFHVGNYSGGFDGSVSTGIVAQIGVRPSFPGDEWPWTVLDQTDTTALPGSSGGGIFLHDGRVVGILVAGLNCSVNAFIPNRVIHRWARANFLDWAMQGETCPTDGELEALIK